MNASVQIMPETYSGYTFRAALERIAGLEAQIQKLRQLNSRNNLVIRIHQSSRIISIPTSDILYIRAEDNYSRIFLKDGHQYYVCRTLKSLAAEVPASDFLRCHRTYLVNRREVREINKGAHEIILGDGIRIATSRRFLKGCVEGVLLGGNKKKITGRHPRDKERLTHGPVSKGICPGGVQ